MSKYQETTEYQKMFDMLKKFEERMREQVGRGDSSEITKYPETYDSFWGTHTHYSVNDTNGNPKLYLERSAPEVPVNKLFFRILNYQRGKNETRKDDMKFLLDVSRTAIIFAIGKGEKTTLAINLGRDGNNMVKIPSQGGKEFSLMKSIDIKKLLMQELKTEGLDPALADSIRQGLDFYKLIEDYSNGKEIQQDGEER